MFDDILFQNDPLTTIQIDTYFMRPEFFNSLPDDDKLFLWRRTRAVTNWNQRAALLKAVAQGLSGSELSNADREIKLIDNWFQRKYYDSNISASTGQSVTPLIDPARLTMLAEQNQRAAQDIAASTVAADLVRIGTDLANIASQNIGGPMRAATGRLMTSARALSGPGGREGERGTILLAILAIAGAGLGLAALAAARALGEDSD